MRVAVAGTFGPLHDGHRSLLETALEVGAEGVLVGLTSDRFATSGREREVPPFTERAEALRRELDALDRWNRGVELREIASEHDFAASDASLEGVVVSRETADEVPDLNEERRANGLEPLVAVVVPLVVAEDGERISSTRVVAGEVDEHGRAGGD
ncbi:pantetheine-phosphate adenylyltransferase [Haloarchaeobius salinus]|uniref:pantetheine-phosphate adenylyltransferase n=1 Tax=Haloarchaeobius salinus TaxID=1198298 RepID=UPI00210B5ED2|nr:pantetheine-phosphate adenylyltransferase [Haloarchaeobius salinus]